MQNQKPKSVQLNTLRNRAEEFVIKNPSAAKEILPKDIQNLIEDLRIHQVELEIQNEELQRAQMELEAARNRYSDLYEFAPVGYITVSEEGLILEANFTSNTLLGVEKSLMIGKPFTRFITSDTQDVYYFHRKKLFETKTKQICELKLEKKDGTQFYAQLESIVLRDRNSNSDRCRIIISDITERVRTTQAFRESEDKYRLLVKTIPSIVYRGYKDWSVDFFDEKTESLTGYDVDEFNSRRMRWIDIIVDEDIESVKEVFTRALKTDKSYVREYRIKSKTGELRWIQERGQIVCNTEGAIEYVSGVFFDITERKQAKKERKELEIQLHQAQKMEAIGMLAGGIAHEFNNILGIIIGNAEVALDEVPDTSLAKECLDEIRLASLRASDVVQQILSFARKDLIEREPVNLTPIIKDCLRLLRSSIPRTIEISQDISCAFDTVLADLTQISQVVMNLCTNAAQAMGEYGGVLKVTLKNVEFENQDEKLDVEPGCYVALTVSDTGPGITPDIIDRIFEPYFTTKEIGKGTGMGLSVVHGIVKSCHGKITIHSEAGKETVFQVLLPVIDAETQLKVEKPGTLPNGTEHILFVDDEQSLVKVARRILEGLGYEVETKINPVEALELFRSGPDRFDLVITDMAMPQMSGQKLVKEILDIRSDMPIILCTGFSEKISEEYVGELNIKDFVIKPFVTHNFALTVRKVLDKK
jgi:PAS domain S-box-containing protein